MVLGSRRSLSGSLRLGPGDDTDREAPGTLKSFVMSELLICIIECFPQSFAYLLLKMEIALLLL